MDIDIKKIVRDVLLPEFRTVILLAYLDALTSPVRWLWAEFTRFRTNIYYKMNHNGQVCKLEKVLNERFDPVDKGIYLVDAGGLDLYYVPPDTALAVDIIYIPPAGSGLEVYVAAPAYYSDYSGIDFIVYVPIGILASGEEDEMRGMLDYFKLASKDYLINYYA